MAIFSNADAAGIALTYDGSNEPVFRYYEKQIVSQKEILGECVREQQRFYEKYVEQKVGRSKAAVKKSKKTSIIF